MSKAILIGRHNTADKMGYDEIVSKNVLFSLEPDEVDEQLVALIDEAAADNSDLVFQNVPAVLAAALLRYQLVTEAPVSAFAIVSKPGPRVAGVTQNFEFPTAEAAAAAADAIRHANARANVEIAGTTVTVTVDPVPAFEFVRLERLL